MFLAAHQTKTEMRFPVAWISDAEGLEWPDRLDEYFKLMDRDFKIVTMKIVMADSMTQVVFQPGSNYKPFSGTTDGPGRFRRQLRELPTDGVPVLLDAGEPVNLAYVSQVVYQCNKVNKRKVGVYRLDEEGRLFEAYERKPGHKFNGYKSAADRHARLIELGGTPKKVDIFS